jgi:hypothetical protein
MRIQVKDFREGYEGLNKYIFFKDAHDWVRGQVTAHNFNVDVVFETANCDLEMSEVNYTPSKWKQLNRVYLNAEELGILCARLLFYKNKKNSKSKVYIPDLGMNFKTRKNASGACLMSLTVGFNQKDGWHCEVFTRASELTMRWFMDLIFVHVLLREIGKIVGFTTDECKVYWHMVSTYQSITSMPLFLILIGKEDWLINNSPEGMDMKTPNPGLSEWQWGTIRRYHKCFVKDGYQNFRVQRRPSEAYRIMKGELEPKKTVLTKNLSLVEMGQVNKIIQEAEAKNMFNKKGAV